MYKLVDRTLARVTCPFPTTARIATAGGISLRSFGKRGNTQSNWITGKCSEPGAHPSRNTYVAPQACRSDRRWRFFPLYGCGKNTTAWMIALTGGAGRLQSFRRWAGSFSAFVPIPSRPSPWLRTNRPDTTSPGRQDRRNYLLIQPTRLY